MFQKSESGIDDLERVRTFWSLSSKFSSNCVRVIRRMKCCCGKLLLSDFSIFSFFCGSFKLGEEVGWCDYVMHCALQEYLTFSA